MDLFRMKIRVKECCRTFREVPYASLTLPFALGSDGIDARGTQKHHFPLFLYPLQNTILHTMSKWLYLPYDLPNRLQIHRTTLLSLSDASAAICHHPRAQSVRWRTEIYMVVIIPQN